MLVQGVMIGGVAAMVSIGLLLINFLDHPYRSGPGSIQPREMTATLTMMRQQEPALRLPGDLPRAGSAQPGRSRLCAD